MATNNSVNTPLSGTTGTGNFVGSSSPAITTPSLGTLNDTSNQAMLQFIPSAGGNWITMENLNMPRIMSAGASSDIGITLKSKGDASINLVTASVAASTFQIYSGTGSQHNTLLKFPTSATTTTVTFPDATGTVALSGASQSVSFGTITTSNSTLNQGASNTTFTGSTALSQTFVPYQTSYNELSGFDFFEGAPFARIAAYKTASGSIIKMGTSNNYGSGITNTAVTIDQSGVMTLSSALPVGSGGSGRTSATAYGVICGGTTSTGAHQSIASVGTSGQVLTSNGAGALPTFQTLQSGNVRAWVSFNGTVTPITITGSGNVTSITDGGVGVYTVNFTNALASATYSALATNGYVAYITSAGGATYSTTACSVDVWRRDSSNQAADATPVCFAAIL